MWGLIWIVATAGLQPCATDDSANCYWNAAGRGNGEGRSYVAVSVGGRFDIAAVEPVNNGPVEFSIYQ